MLLVFRTCQKSVDWCVKGERFSKIASSMADPSIGTWIVPSNDLLIIHPVLPWESWATGEQKKNRLNTRFLRLNMFNDEEDIHTILECLMITKER